VQRLRIRSHGAYFSIDHSDGIRYDVEDRLELSDAAGEVLPQIFAFGDVDAGEKKTTCRSCRAATATTRALGQRREGDLDESSTCARLERDSRRDDWHTVQGVVDLIGEIRERIGERVVDRSMRR